MFIFPLVYILSFVFAINGILKGNRAEALVVIIFGLPLYITALSVTFDLGFSGTIIFFQSFKELTIVLLFGTQIWTLKTRIKFQLIDYCVMAFFAYALLYALLPIGEYDLISRIIALKSISFFPIVYFSGRLIDPKSIYINKYFHYILFVTIATGVVVIIEQVTYTHLQTFTGYADYHYYFYNLDPSGEFGLSFTFGVDGLKRFASFFANPLEHAGATLISLAVIAALYTDNNTRFKPNTFGKTALIASLFSIFLALSRSAFLSYFVVIYAYAVVTKKKYILHIVHLFVASAALYFIFLLNQEDVREFVISTLNFTNPSSVGHVIEWLDGINSMITKPLGLGLGASGRIAGSLGQSVGGENQFIIIGVQLGVVAFGLYIFIYSTMIRTAWKWFYKLRGKEKKVSLMILLMKIGFIIPLFTSELESSPYISYMTWFFSGLFISIIAQHTSSREKNTNPVPILTNNV